MPGCAGAATKDWKISSSINSTSGYYGTDTRTSTLYIPVTLKRYYDAYDLSLTLPYISQTSNGDVTTVSGSTLRVKRSRTATDTVTNSGMGDVLLKGTYYLFEEGPYQFTLDMAGKIKCPTADEDKGLGTGKWDYGLGLELSKRLKDPRSMTLLADIYYTFIGDPAGTDLRDQIAVAIGLSRALTKDLTATAMFETSSALVKNNSAATDISCTVEYKENKDTRFFGGFLIGLSDGSPDYGISAGGSYRFSATDLRRIFK